MGGLLKKGLLGRLWILGILPNPTQLNLTLFPFLCSVLKMQILDPLTKKGGEEEEKKTELHSHYSTLQVSKPIPASF